MKLEPYTEELRGCPVKGNAYPVLVLGIGNPLMGDDGAGVELAHRLQERDYGPLVHVEEGGTQGMTLLPLLEEGGTAPCVCKIDCLKTGDGALFQRMGLPCVAGLSGDICPDHVFISHLPEH